MSIPDRYKVKRTFYKRLPNNKTRVFQLVLIGADVWTEIGSFDDKGVGALVMNIHETSRAEVALVDYLRQLKSKLKEGYIETYDLSSALGETSELPQIREEGLPDLLRLEETCPGFRPWEPQSNLIWGSPLWRRAVQGQALYMVEREGYEVMLAVGRTGFEIYDNKGRRAASAGGTLRDRLVMVEDWMEVYGVLIPPDTLILAKVILLSEDEESSQHDRVLEIISSRVEKAIQKQESEHFLGLLWEDILIWAGSPIGKISTAADRLGLISDTLQSAESGKPNSGLSHALEHGAGYHPKEVMKIDLPPSPPVMVEPRTVLIDSTCADPLSSLLSDAVTYGWDGLRVIDPQAMYGEDAWRTDGVVPQPEGVSKLTPVTKDDFVAILDPAKGEGWVDEKSLAVSLYQWDGDNLRYCGWCSKGFTEKDRKCFAHDLIDRPMVMSIAFHAWTVEGRLKYPFFLQVLEDKDIEDCIYSGPWT